MLQAITSSVWATPLATILMWFVFLIVLGRTTDHWFGKWEDRWGWHESKMCDIEHSLLTERDFREALEEHTKRILEKIEALEERLEMLEDWFGGTDDR